MRLAAATFVLVSVLGCAGADPSDSSSPAGAGASTVVPEASPLPSVARSAAPLATASDEEAVLQALLDSNKLDPFFHVDVRPERSPLVVLTRLEVRAGSVKKFGVPVVVATERSSSTPQLAIVNHSVGSSEASLSFTYEVEGVTGVAKLHKEAGVWKMADIRVNER